MNFKTIQRALMALALITFFSFSANAQKIGYVNVNDILESIEEYQAAQQELDKLAAKWRQEIAQQYDEIKGMYNRYQAEQVLLSDDARNQREEEIMNMEKEVRDLQKVKFGPEGELFQRRQELVRPIQDRVYAAIEAYATERDYDFIFDKSSSAGMIFSNPKFDLTQEILKKLQ
ncbi:MAG TPA: OmpH family outer membrane protein [Saprospiraceae bacterium]|nr:OmpH family outer membrane protein [Saprospiraceae bacterium]HMQ81589.1 OmpH family outer membrane protein [Saprospiraceae bacterium]